MFVSYYYHHHHVHLFIHAYGMHHTGSQQPSNQANNPEEYEVVQQEEEQVVQPGDEGEEEFSECPDHRPSAFEQGKPRCILTYVFINHFESIYIYVCAFTFTGVGWR